MNFMDVQRDLQAQKILKENGLDFTIEKRKLVDQTDVLTNPFDKTLKPTSTPYYALKNMKTNKYIYNCTGSYHVSQTKDLLDLVLKGINEIGQVSVQKGGSINGGKRTFLQLKIAGQSKVGNDDISKYLTVLDSNDGSSAISFGIGDLTASCMNQFFQFYKEAETKIYHSQSMEEKLLDVPNIIYMQMQESFKMIELYNEFQSTSITKDLSHQMVNQLIGIDRTFSKNELEKLEISSRKINTMGKIYSHIDKEINNKGLNLWGLHSGITSYNTHARSVPRRTNGRLESLIMGSAYKDNHKSLEFCKSMLVAN